MGTIGDIINVIREIFTKYLEFCSFLTKSYEPHVIHLSILILRESEVLHSLLHYKRKHIRTTEYRLQNKKMIINLMHSIQK